MATTVKPTGSLLAASGIKNLNLCDAIAWNELFKLFFSFL
jgi:hypothetical protein